MSKSKKHKINAAKIGNFTKNAVKNFENNIVTQENYLESVKRSDDSK